MFDLHHPAALSLSFSHKIGGEKAMKNLMDSGWGDHSPVMITGKRDSHEEKEFNLLKIKIDLGEKQKQNHHPLFTFSQAQLCSSCTTLLLRWHRGMRNVGLGVNP